MKRIVSIEITASLESELDEDEASIELAEEIESKVVEGLLNFGWDANANITIKELD